MPPEKRLAWVVPRSAADDAVDENSRELLAALGLAETEYREWLEDAARTRAARLAPFRELHLTTLQQLNGQIDGGLSWQRIMLPVTRSVEGVRILTPFFDAAFIALALSLTVSLKYRDGNTEIPPPVRPPKTHLGDFDEKARCRLPRRPLAHAPLPSERSLISPSLRPYYDRLSRRNTMSLGRMVNHHLKVASLGLWMDARNL